MTTSASAASISEKTVANNQSDAVVFGRDYSILTVYAVHAVTISDEEVGALWASAPYT